MPTINLTQALIDEMVPPASGRVEYFDSSLPGLALRVTVKGHKSWTILYRHAGKLRRYTIGPLNQYPELSEAREIARNALRALKRGSAPTADKTPADQTPDLVRAVVEGIKRHFEPKRSEPTKTRDIFHKPRSAGVYVIERADGKRKIGRSTRPFERLGGLQTGTPDKLTLAFWLACENAKQVEEDAHALLYGRWVGGEWFDVSLDRAISALLSAAGLTNGSAGANGNGPKV